MPRKDDADADADLMRRVAEDDGDAVRVLDDRFRGLVTSVVQQFNRLDRDDAVQNAMIALWRNAGRFDPARGCLRAFVYAVARNAALDGVRREKLRRHLEIDDRAPAPPPSRDRLEASEEAARSLKAIDRLRLTPRERAANLVLVRGVTYSAAAAAFGLSVGTVKSAVHHIRHGLRERCGAEDDRRLG